jgi:hypothetical protein
MTGGLCGSCGCTDARACPGGCVWANASATLCSRCALEGPRIVSPDELEAPTYADELGAALELGGFEGGVLPTMGPGFEVEGPELNPTSDPFGVWR